ncbi:nucleotidyltransferase family protein [Vulgatibacter incomptus]|uniref:Uncharacterized protein n=1 Tax=Vulgatibacter incomptus TaxID=1391653 RepID=A0A0K1PFY1_9BACT|nr:nucleotidyltransferase family protein [Vulgatibacter incomptus]AKU92425.1 hypothetical protein AKJ08_2812 [Vulgatibacter incomptus]
MEGLPDARWLAELTRFSPARGIDDPPSWEEAVPFLAHHGLAAIAGYNLQYRMPDADAPDSAKDLLLGYLQGLANDNVFKLMTLKGVATALGGEPLVLLDGAALGEPLYPHVAFRPVPELRILVRAGESERIAEAMRAEQFVEMEADEPDPDAPAKVLFNDRFFTKLYEHVLPVRGEEPGLFERTVRVRAFGPGVCRLSAEDAFLVHVLSMARRGFAVPLIYFVDLREMVKGEASVALGRGPGAPLDVAVVRERAKAFGAERALWAGLELLAFFHPDVAEAARALQPELSLPSRALLEAGVVGPAKALDRERQLRGLGKLVQLLLG